MEQTITKQTSDMEPPSTKKEENLQQRNRLGMTSRKTICGLNQFHRGMVG